MKVLDINISRIEYLRDLYGFSNEELLEKISVGLKNALQSKDIFENPISINHLKRVDKVFQRGLNFYTDPVDIEKIGANSVFFRKEEFNTELTYGAKKVVSDYEELNLSLSNYNKLSNFTFDRIFSVHTIRNNPKNTGLSIRRSIDQTFRSNAREFLKKLVETLSDYNILVFEFIENWNKKEKANIDGFFIKPNSIILKRNKYPRRELFTLVHELGHYLLDDEEIEQLDYENVIDNSTNQTEYWCNEFAFYFLLHTESSRFEAIDSVNSRNDYQRELIDDISQKTHLSTLALYTNLLLKNKLTNNDYNLIKEEIIQSIRNREDRLKRQREREEELGIEQFFRQPKPIVSPLYKDTVQRAFLDGVINEREFCEKLNISPNEIQESLD